MAGAAVSGGGTGAGGGGNRVALGNPAAAEHLRLPPLADGYAFKLVETYDWLESIWSPVDEVDIGQIALATTLDWPLFRGLPDCRPARPKLATWFEGFVARPLMQATPLSGETRDTAPQG